jgi:hypothetical protein
MAVCSIPKLFRRNFSPGDQFTGLMVKMTNKRIRLAINWVLKKGEPIASVANDFKVSKPRIQQLIKLYKKT